MNERLPNQTEVANNPELKRIDDEKAIIQLDCAKLYDAFYPKIYGDKAKDYQDRREILFENYKKFLQPNEMHLKDIDKEYTKITQSSDRHEKFLNNEKIKSSLIPQSAIFFKDRRQSWVEAGLDDQLVDQFVKLAGNYFNTFLLAGKYERERGMNSIEENQERFESIDKRRRNFHNQLIITLNELNNQCRQLKIIPFTYRNFTLNTKEKVNRDQPELYNQVANDRRTVAYYAYMTVIQYEPEYLNLSFDP